jgi:hypothetical protein
VRGKNWSVFSLLVSLAALSALMTESASARPSICLSLERQLANAGSGGGGSNFSRYARAAAAQGEQISIARSQARNAGCGGGFLSIFSSIERPRSCGRILNTIRRMESNHAALLRKRDNLSGGGSGGPRRAILAALDANDCRGGAKIVNVKAPRKLPAPVRGDVEERASLYDQIFEEDNGRDSRKERTKAKKQIQKVRDNSENGDGARRGGDSVYVPGGTVRTLCVRTCDGFYFPVSFSTTKDRFSKDAAACSAMCPGAETKLYYHSIPDEEPEQMVDLSGSTYMSMPNAFKYRINGARATPGCSCQAVQEVQSEPESEAIETAAAKTDKKPKKWIAVPLSRAEWIVDPETTANLRGALTAEQLGDFLGTPDGTGATASLEPGRIRVVGPAFLPAQRGASALKQPDETSVR